MSIPVCRCAHLQTDHKSNRASFPHPLEYGVCLVPGCGCQTFRARDDEQPQEENAA